MYQSPDLSRFLAETLKLGDPTGPRSELDVVHEVHAPRVWRENPGVLSREECVASGDPVLEAFARELPTGYEVVDLRRVAIGDGVSWGRYGPRTRNRRAGEQAVFAYEKRSRGQRFRDWLGLGG